MKTTILSIAFSLFGFICVQAQENTVVAGGNATGTGGTASYSVGQVVYTSNANTTGSVSQGLQQAYEIYALGVSEIAMDISLTVYPNPTTDKLNLKVDNAEGLRYELYDLQGRLIVGDNISTTTTTINTGSLPRATYLVKVITAKNLVKTFKVIKK